MGYTRIEPLPGGRQAFAALEHDAKTGDGRERITAQRRDRRWSAGEAVIRLHREPGEEKSVEDLHEDGEGFGVLPSVDVLGKIGADGVQSLLASLAGGRVVEGRW